MDKSERLNLAVEAQLASIRAGQVRERTAILERHYGPIARAINAYLDLYGREADPADHLDVFLGLVIEQGGVDLGREDLLTAMEMYAQRAAADSAAAQSMHRLREAMGEHQGPVLTWVSCTKRHFNAALAERLKL